MTAVPLRDTGPGGRHLSPTRDITNFSRYPSYIPRQLFLNIRLTLTTNNKPITINSMRPPAKPHTVTVRLAKKDYETLESISDNKTKAITKLLRDYADRSERRGGDPLPTAD